MTIPIDETLWAKYSVSREGPVPAGIVLHHSFSPDGKQRDWDGIKKYHTSFRYQGEIITETQYAEHKRLGQTSGLEKPWTDIGYHIGFEKIDGKLTVQTGRQIKTPGAHAIGLDAKGRSFNAYYIGLCVVGCFDKILPDADILFLCASVCRDLIRLFGFTAGDVIGHRETFAIRGVPVEKSCPGTAWDLDSFRERLI